MTATIRKLVSKPDRLQAEQADLLLNALRPFEGEMPGAVRELKAHIQRRTASRSGWTFVMISPNQNRAVVDWLEANSLRPMKAMRLLAVLFTAMDQNTGEVLFTRDELAELVGDSVQHVSDIMGELEGIGAISRRRERVAGTRGQGRVRYFMNPVVGTHLAGRERDEAQAEAPLLRVMEGGKAPRASK